MDDKTKRENFKRITERRVSTIIEEIRSLRRLKNKSFYKYEDKEIKNIFDLIEEELKNTSKIFYERKKL